jgi:hypothetical protein
MQFGTRQQAHSLYPSGTGPHLPQLQDWYNLEQLYSSLGYREPWQQLVAEMAVPTERREEFSGVLPGYYAMNAYPLCVYPDGVRTQMGQSVSRHPIH